jgi:hypothetical protein
VELGHADELSYETVRRTLKKTSSQAPPQASVGDPSEGKSAAAFVWRMEEILLISLRRALRPEEAGGGLLCDERPCQLNRRL